MSRTRTRAVIRKLFISSLTSLALFILTASLPTRGRRDGEQAESVWPGLPVWFLSLRTLNTISKGGVDKINS